MCGIGGFIGKSKNYKQTFKIMTNLFSNLEIRGEDASGFWGTEIGDNGNIIYYKEPIKGSEFIKTQSWNKLKNVELDMLLIHTRGASVGVGSPHDNKNNHPFVSKCGTIGLIHNGRIPNNEYHSLIKKYEVESDCDSELFLRIFESQYEDDINFCKEVNEQTRKRLIGLKDIWSFSNKTQMAVAIGEKLEKDKKRLWLFRNKHRTLSLFDMREELGQIFFCSTPEIWIESIKSAKLNKTFKSFLISELPTEEIWSLEINNENSCLIKDNLNKYIVQTSGSNDWQFNEKEEKFVSISNKLENDLKEPVFLGLSENNLEQCCDNISELINKISSDMSFKIENQSLTYSKYNLIKTILKKVENDLELINLKII
jgi:predicted glutamine amidotransferase